MSARFSNRALQAVPAKETQDLVLGILRKHAPEGLTTKQILEEGLAILPPGPSLPPRNSPRLHRSAAGTIIRPMNEPLNHPLRSQKYLKSVVIQELVNQGWVQKKCVSLDEKVLTEVERERFEVQGGGFGQPRAWRWMLADPEKSKRGGPNTRPGATTRAVLQATERKHR